MDPFDDILQTANVARPRAGGKFMPKAKLKPIPQKKISPSANATSSKDGKNKHAASSSTGTDTQVVLVGSNCIPQVDFQKLEDARNSETGNPQQVGENEDTAALVDGHPSSIPVSEVDADLNSTNSAKPACEADPVSFEEVPVSNFILDSTLSNDTRQPVHPAVENLMSNVLAAPSSTLEITDNPLQVDMDVGFENASVNKVTISEIHAHSNCSFEREHEVKSAEFEIDPFCDTRPHPGSRSAHKFQPKIKPRPRVGTTVAIASASSNVMIEKSAELPTSCTIEAQSFQSSVDRSGGLNQSTNLPSPSSEIPSQLDSLNPMLSDVAVHNGTGDWPSSFAKSATENTDIFCGLESLDDLLSQPASDTGKPALHSFNEKGSQENFLIPKDHTTQDSLSVNEAAVLNKDGSCTNNRRLDTEEIEDLNPACPVDDVIDYQSLKSGADPTSEIPVHEEMSNAANSPTLADILHGDITGEKENANERNEDGMMSSSLRKHKRSSIADEKNKGRKTSTKRRTAGKRVNKSVNEDVEDDDPDPPYHPDRDDVEETDDEFEADDSSKKRKSASSTKKSVAKNEKTSQKRKRVNKNSEKTTKEPSKKFSHSTRRRKRCVDKALLEIPEDELDPRTLPLRDIILLAEYKERLAKKEAATTKTSSTCQSGGDSLHEANGNYEADANYGADANYEAYANYEADANYEAGAYCEEEFLGSEYGREPGDDEASESVPLAPSLFNYQSFMDKAPRGKWSKQDTELFYEAVRQFGTDFSMIQQLFPDKTRHQVKLKYKKEERQHPLRLADAVNNRAKDHTHFKLVIERLQQASKKADQDLSGDAPDAMSVEEVEDMTRGTNEVAATEQGAKVKDANEEDVNVKDQEDSVAFHSPEQEQSVAFHSPEQEQSDDNDEFQDWAQYKSEY